MSKAYYFAKNFTFKTIMNLICYSTQTPETLTSTQKITRLYRANIRSMYAANVKGLRPDFVLFNEDVNNARRDFSQMLKLDVGSVEFQSKLKKWEQVLEDGFDPNMVIDDSRPYSGSAGKYLVWANESLEYDPFGYYKPRLLAGRFPDANFPYYEDYPMVDSHWDIWETFPAKFDDTPDIA